MTENQDKDRKIVVGVTHGDINSISYEIIIKTFQARPRLDASA